jgi:CRP-like cAMP-binding protein
MRYAGRAPPWLHRRAAGTTTMRMVSRSAADWSLRSFSAAGRLAADDQDLLERLLGPPRRCPAGGWVERQAGDEQGAWLVIMGWAGQARVLADGRRQIGRVLIPGDVFGLIHTPGPRLAGLTALTDVVVADIAALRRALAAGESPALARAWAAKQGAELAGAFAHIMRLGRFSAYERTGHLLLELYDRLAAAGLAQGGTMPMPLTQVMLADCLGLSVVHLNRMLQQLRRNRLIACDARKVVFLDIDRLAADCLYASPRPAVRAADPRRADGDAALELRA